MLKRLVRRLFRRRVAVSAPAPFERALVGVSRGALVDLAWEFLCLRASDEGVTDPEAIAAAWREVLAKTLAPVTAFRGDTFPPDLVPDFQRALLKVGDPMEALRVAVGHDDLEPPTMPSVADPAPPPPGLNHVHPRRAPRLTEAPRPSRLCVDREPGCERELSHPGKCARMEAGRMVGLPLEEPSAT
jgi:hypothetical protein